jgi:hypothetical protein
VSSTESRHRRCRCVIRRPNRSPPRRCRCQHSMSSASSANTANADESMSATRAKSTTTTTTTSIGDATRVRRSWIVVATPLSGPPRTGHAATDAPRCPTMPPECRRSRSPGRARSPQCLAPHQTQPGTGSNTRGRPCSGKQKSRHSTRHAIGCGAREHERSDRRRTHRAISTRCQINERNVPDVAM